jgi:hypothetical protein
MPSNTRTHVIQAILFVVTIITTTMAGAEWMFGNIFSFVYDMIYFLMGQKATEGAPIVAKPMGWPEFVQGFHFSIPFLLILTIHEFGHYFVARAHQVKVTLPYYIPLWFGISQSIGTRVLLSALNPL